MQLTHSFAVPVDVDIAWQALSDLEVVASCMPGATLHELDGDRFVGEVRVRVGPMGLTYRGEGTVAELDPVTRRMKVKATGKEARGQGTAKAAVRAELREAPDATDVTIITDLDVTGKPAQFGRGVMDDVGQKLLDRFADELADRLSGPAASTTHAATATPAATADDSGGEAIDLLELAGGAVGKRVAIGAGLAALVALLAWLLRR